MSAFGYFRPTAPFLDTLAANGVLFAKCYASTSITLPSHVSMLTGLHLPQHRVFSNWYTEMDPAIRTVPEEARRMGYDTAGYVSVPFMGILGRGFRRFEGFLRSPEHLIPVSLK